MGCGASSKKNTKLDEATSARLKELFDGMDEDKDGSVTKEEAKRHFKGKFGALSADAMFNEVVKDNVEQITFNEFLQFWEQVKKSGYSDKDILEEVEEMKEGSAWVDWKDERDVGGK
eukprot:TRINITY_DN103310_c0_g1_i1.p1 TRINITY_DN103310_c0_g1~~TRINITY_DN103310_c0_g1_i1.p1  ORF type:complete len:117 (-),score=51.01 TRINITY_DN103310_c0_g1_i1:205-555(-)